MPIPGLFRVSRIAGFSSPGSRSLATASALERQNGVPQGVDGLALVELAADSLPVGGVLEVAQDEERLVCVHELWRRAAPGTSRRPKLGLARVPLTVVSEASTTMSKVAEKPFSMLPLTGRMLVAKSARWRTVSISSVVGFLAGDRVL